MCLFVQTAAMTDGGTLARKKSEEWERGNKDCRGGGGGGKGGGGGGGWAVS